jgi:hypothetical protein
MPHTVTAVRVAVPTALGKGTASDLMLHKRLYISQSALHACVDQAQRRVVVSTEK